MVQLQTTKRKKNQQENKTKRWTGFFRVLGCSPGGRKPLMSWTMLCAHGHNTTVGEGWQYVCEREMWKWGWEGLGNRGREKGTRTVIWELRHGVSSYKRAAQVKKKAKVTTSVHITVVTCVFAKCYCPTVADTIGHKWLHLVFTGTACIVPRMLGVSWHL